MNHYSSNPNWATELGNHLGIATHGPVGFAAISAPTVGKAISTFVEWFQIRNAFYTSKVIEKDKSFEITIEDTTGDQSYQLFFFESFMRGFEILITQLLGQPPTNETAIFFENKLLENSLVKNDLNQSKYQPLPTFKTMSELTHHTERTLTRKLNKLGVSYKEILREERKNLVDKLLKDGRYTIIAISYLLGYNEPASFCRAFKTWFGMNPSQYRRNMKY